MHQPCVRYVPCIHPQGQLSLWARRVLVVNMCCQNISLTVHQGQMGYLKSPKVRVCAIWLSQLADNRPGLEV